MNNVINKIIDYRNRMGWQENDTLDSISSKFNTSSIVDICA